MKKRVFVAISIHPTIEFLDFYDEIRIKLVNENIKWVRPENFHLTIEFIGKIENEEINRIIALISEEVSQHKAFTIVLENLGFFGKKHSPRVIWVGIKYDKKMEILASDIKSRLNPDTGGDSKDFKPHLTLGRIKRIKNIANFQYLIDSSSQRHFFTESVNEVILYESELKQEGAFYSVLKRFALR